MDNKQNPLKDLKTSSKYAKREPMWDFIGANESGALVIGSGITAVFCAWASYKGLSTPGQRWNLGMGAGSFLLSAFGFGKFLYNNIYNVDRGFNAKIKTITATNKLFEHADQPLSPEDKKKLNSKKVQKRLSVVAKSEELEPATLQEIILGGKGSEYLEQKSQKAR